ncbi:NHL repeat-containing protein [Auricularia subglabra TFB-10046 SS5]|nr:NHL repeat-containing protein [Auricularia subglabra TFB-10046 SS5]
MVSLCALAILGVSLAGAFASAVREVTTFPTGVWLENIAVRSNGALLATRVDKAETVVFSFRNTTSTLGIVQVSHDVFAVATGNYTATGSTPGSYSIWTLDFRGSAKVTKVADVPEAGVLNGLKRLDDSRVLAADSINGVVYAVDLGSGTATVVLGGKDFEAPPLPAFHTGVNGIHIHRAALYFTNSGVGTLARVPLDQGKDATVEVLADGLELPDDFALTSAGNAFVTLNIVRSVVRLSSDGKRTHVTGGPESTDFATPTTAQFGRTDADRETLYVVTGGVRDESGNALSAAKVLAVDVSSLSQ